MNKKASSKPCDKRNKCHCADKCDKCAKCDKCHCAAATNSSVLPLCCLFSIITGVIIALLLALSFASLARDYNLIDASTHRGSYNDAIRANQRDDESLIVLRSSAVVDWLYNTNASGFLLVTTSNCDSFCQDLNARLGNLAKDDDGLEIFHYEASSINSTSRVNAQLAKMTLGGYSGPVLLYIKDGTIFDRADNNDIATIESFVARYR